MNGEKHGVWTGYDQSGNQVGTIRFENGRRIGGSESALRTWMPSRPGRRSSSHPQQLGHLRSMCRDAQASARNLPACWLSRLPLIAMSRAVYAGSIDSSFQRLPYQGLTS